MIQFAILVELIFIHFRTFLSPSCFDLCRFFDVTLVMVAWGVKNHDGGHYSFPLSHVKSQQTTQSQNRKCTQNKMTISEQSCIFQIKTFPTK
jgi:hypothetical protein